ncbi:MAG: hypothetical protein PHC60_03160 [Heliobacteriaceae bacterium]|nr:hypothetical protein [Heliobacteriaceae bacterium]MDD4587379.1 hypothetical protein [Heliobacteriaceae bacterium]
MKDTCYPYYPRYPERREMARCPGRLYPECQPRDRNLHKMMQEMMCNMMHEYGQMMYHHLYQHMRYMVMHMMSDTTRPLPPACPAYEQLSDQPNDYAEPWDNVPWEAPVHCRPGPAPLPVCPLPEMPEMPVTEMPITEKPPAPKPCPAEPVVIPPPAPPSFPRPPKG